MTKFILSAIIMALIFIACNSKSDKAKEATPIETTTPDTLAKKEETKPIVEQLFACPMHPEVIGKKDDKCPKCGMKLTVLVKNSENPK